MKDTFGPFADYVRNLACLVCGSWPSEPHHVRSRGAGGTDVVGRGSHGNLVPLCPSCHRAGHQGGWRTFQRNHRVDLACEAERIYRRYSSC